MPDPLVLEVQAFPQEMAEDPHVLSLDWVSFFAMLEWPMRMVTLPHRVDVQQPLRHIDNLLMPLNERERRLAPLAQTIMAWSQSPPHEQIADQIEQLPEMLQGELLTALGSRDPRKRDSWDYVLSVVGQPLWRRQPLQLYRQECRRSMTQGTLRSVRHFLLVWPPDGIQARDVMDMVQDTFDTPAWEAPLPSFLPGGYIPGVDYLSPQRAQHPFVRFATPYRRQGRWRYDSIHRILNMPFDVGIVIDVQTMSPTKAEVLTDHAEVARRNQVIDAAKGASNVQAEKKEASARYLKQALDSQSLHELRFVVGIRAPDLESLDNYTQRLCNAVRSRLPMMVPTCQRQLEHFFRPTPTQAIFAHTKVSIEASEGAAFSVPFGLEKPAGTEGIEWLQQAQTKIRFDPFADHRAAHFYIVGETGLGKTTAAFTWLYRWAALGASVICVEPQGHCWRLAHAAGVGGTLLQLDARQTYNIFDCAVGCDSAGNPPAVADQVDYVIDQFAGLLGTPDRTGVQPYTWDVFERAVLDAALHRFYAPWSAALHQLLPEATPTMATFVSLLQQLAQELCGDAQHTAQRLASLFETRFIHGSYGSLVNGVSTVQWRQSHQVMCFDLSALRSSVLRAFCYSQLFAWINRLVRDPQRDRTHPLIIFLDEAGLILRFPAIRVAAADGFKSYRTFNGHLGLADQDFHRLDNAQDDDMLSITNNAAIQVFFGQNSANTERIAARVDGLRGKHVQAIRKGGRGKCVLVWKQGSDRRSVRVFSGKVELTPEEKALFIGM